MFSLETKDYYRKNKSILLLYLLWLIRIMFLEQGNVGGVAINKYVVIQLIAELGIFACLLCRNFKFAVLFSTRPIIWFSLLYLLGMTSIFWGVLPIMGCYFAFQNLIMLAALYYLASGCKDFLQLERLYIFVNLVIMMLFIFRGILHGGYWHSVSYSTVGAFIFVYCAAEYNRKTRPPENLKMMKRGMILSGLVLLLTTSSGAMVSVAAGIFVLAFFSKRSFWRIVSFAFLTAILVSYYLGAVDWVFSFFFPGKSMASIESAHGREYIWNLIFEKAAERPWLGWGYASVERILDLYCVDAHNSFIGVLGSLGYIGCGILVLAMLSLLYFTFMRYQYPGFRGLLAASVCGLVNSNTSNFIASKAGCHVLAFQMIIILAAVYWRQYQTQKSSHKLNPSGL